MNTNEIELNKKAQKVINSYTELVKKAVVSAHRRSSNYEIVSGVWTNKLSPNARKYVEIVFGLVDKSHSFNSVSFAIINGEKLTPRNILIEF